LDSETVNHGKRCPTGNGFLLDNETVSPGLHPINKNRTRNIYTRFSAPKSENQRESAATSDVDFERAWAVYPKRAGGNSRKEALRAWTARVRSGVDPNEMTAGVERYAEYIRATGKEGTEYVKQGARFSVPVNTGKSHGAFPRRQTVVALAEVSQHEDFRRLWDRNSA